MKFKLILVSRDGDRRDWDEGEGEQIRTFKRKLQQSLFEADTDHLRLLCAGRELEDGKTLGDALKGVKEPIALHVVSVRTNKSSIQMKKSSSSVHGNSLCSHLCIIQ
jgi:hypothetical protein